VFALLAFSCDGSGVGTTYPVRGKITLGGEPFTAETTIVLFVPDASKGNSSRLQPTGSMGEDGYYELSTNGKSGSPAGWYRVCVTAHGGQPLHAKTAHRQRPVVRSLVPAKYGTAQTTDLVIEVVPSPASGSYDLALVR
jgi:hypothetical protein